MGVKRGAGCCSQAVSWVLMAGPPSRVLIPCDNQLYYTVVQGFSMAPLFLAFNWIGASNRPSWPRTGRGLMRRTSVNIHAHRFGSRLHIAAGSSAWVIGRQSTRFTRASAQPAGGTAGRLEETMSNGPRYFVGHFRTSMVLSPAAIRLAQGCRMGKSLHGRPVPPALLAASDSHVDQAEDGGCQQSEQRPNHVPDPTL